MRKLSAAAAKAGRLTVGLLLGLIIIGYAAWHLLNMGSFFYKLF